MLTLKHFRHSLMSCIATWLVIAAVLYRGLIPLGFMPTPAASGFVALAICSASDLRFALRQDHPLPAVQVSMHAEAGADVHASAHGAAGTSLLALQAAMQCPFALAAMPALAAVHAIGGWVLSVAHRPRATPPQFFVVVLHALRPPARAPPDLI